MKWTVIASLLQAVCSRKLLMDGVDEVKSPVHVEAEFACDELCVFKDAGLNQWCFKATSPHLLVGWQFQQQFA
jgi:hypothetical protein